MEVLQKMSSSAFACLLLLVANGLQFGYGDQKLPMVINTWPFVDANLAAKKVLQDKGSALDAIERGCSQCEVEQCDGSVGYGGSPDEHGETTLDAMIMDGETHDVGSVGCLRNVKSAISVARNVLEHTQHTLLVGNLATEFAISMGFKNESLETNKSTEQWKTWKEKNCQPNYWNTTDLSPDPSKSCGPYHPTNGPYNISDQAEAALYSQKRRIVGHDTIGMVAIDAVGRIACGTTTNGLTYKIPGRVGDSPIAGAGCYVEKGVGGAAATGDGDIMMRFLPSYKVVQSMKAGMSPRDAVQDALNEISQYYTYIGAMIAVNIKGEYGGTHVGKDFDHYEFTVYNPSLGNSTIIKPD